MRIRTHNTDRTDETKKMLSNKYSFYKLPLKMAIYFLGMIISCAGTAMITLNGLGSNAMNTLFSAIAVKLNVQLGNIYTAFNGTMLLVGFLFARRYMGIGSFLMLVVQGLFLNFWMGFFASNAPWLFRGWVKCFTAVLGLVVNCLGLSLSFSMQLGTAGYEASLYTLADTIKIEYKYIKATSEVVFFLIAFFLNGVFGPLTIIEWVAPFISSFFSEKFNKTLWTKLGIDDERNNLSRNRRRRKTEVT